MIGRQSGIGPDLIDAARVVAERGGDLGRPLELLASTLSTNDDAKQAARRGAPHGATWVAEVQTSGRGRQGRAWLSAAGENLLFSVLLRRSLEPARLPPIALLAGLAVRDAVARVLGRVEVKIKWPNDVWVGEKKIAGVLVEAMSRGPSVDAVVVGVGINVHARSLPSEIAERATSVVLEQRDAPAPSRALLLADVLEGLDRDLHVVATRGLGIIRSRLDAADALRGRSVQNDTGERGVAGGIDDAGRLLVRHDDGSVAHWMSGEVHLSGRSPG